jgi:FkbM family methyltransferase
MSVEVNGCKYSITNPNDMIQSVLLKKYQWNAEVVNLIEALINSRLCNHFVNIGSHIGTVCIPISKCVEKVTAIEAYPPTFTQLVNNIRMNGITNITCHNVAVGDSEDIVYFMSDESERIKNNTGGMHVFKDVDIQNNIRSANICDKKYNCKMVRFDDMNVDEFDIILIDIEGMEFEFLQGAVKKIAKNKPIIIIEIWDDEKRKSENMNTTQKEIVTQILNLNYKLFTNIGDDFVFLPVE